ncbi:S1C family serine protease [Laedolimicola intestinihominis]|uniref:Trypsin-like peptidase domain-containing protein n=1 Tax=Laedolimicola intestinihominis TaxID=3133166 RepID=A0ABV1FCN0_9FIRM
MGNIKKGSKFAAMALAFGVLASTAFQGSNYLYNKANGGTVTATDKAELNIASAVSSSSTDAAGTDTDSSASVSTIAEAAMPSLVAITNKSVQEMQSMFGQTQAYESESSGSGIIIGKTDTELLMVTNNHVVSGAQDLSVGFVDESVAEAAVRGTDADHDIAVIAVKLSDLSEDTLSAIKVIEIGSSSNLEVGEQVVAIGNALGYGQSVTTGIVSALNREVTIDNTANTLIQTDAAINPGNSGGALLNMSGQLVGINSAKYSDTSVEGMGYAIPVDDVVDIIENLMNRQVRTEKAAEGERGFLGISGQDVTSEVSQAYDMPKGVYITSVETGSAAEQVGLQKGDIITKFDGTSVSALADLKEQLAYYKTGEQVEITYSTRENGQYAEKTATVTLGQSK